MTEKELISNITKKINQGTEKSIIYNQFKDEIKDETLIKILASVPSYKLRQKFKKNAPDTFCYMGCFHAT